VAHSTQGMVSNDVVAEIFTWIVTITIRHAGPGSSFWYRR
jgi:hypothetical protein